MVCCLAQNAIRDGLKAKVEALVADDAPADVKEAASGSGWIPTAVGATNGTATEKLVAALEACGCDEGTGYPEEQGFPWQEVPVDLRW